MPITVEKIESGTVIDHIVAGCGLRVLHILGIDKEFEGRVALVMNVTSKTMGKKDIVKIEGKFIDEKAADIIALISPSATLNLIKNSEVVEKRNVRMPRSVQGVLRCPNPKCITNFEKIATKFNVEENGLRCLYCERMFEPEELV